MCKVDKADRVWPCLLYRQTVFVGLLDVGQMGVGPSTVAQMATTQKKIIIIFLLFIFDP